jgi:RNA polymerase sigma-70 factor (ECF subfamily)
MAYLIFNEGYSTNRGEAPARVPLCEEAIRLARLLLRLFQTEPEIMGLTALLLLQHARAPARFDENGEIVLLEDQDRSLWSRKMIDEGLALVDKALRHQQPGPYQVQAAIAARMRERRRRTRTGPRSTCSTACWRDAALPVVTLNRAVAVARWGRRRPLP